jgi:type VII secretion protein EccB
VTRRDQLQAYRFVTRRIVGAMLAGEPETTDRPMRRLGIATFSGLMVGALSLGAVGAFGMLAPGNAKSWQNGRDVIVVKGTGDRYVYRDGTLYPVLNYTSARLLAGPGAGSVQVSARSLEGTPRGATLGISGAPDSLPEKDRLVTSAWAVCAGRAGAGAEPFVGLLVGAGREGRPVEDEGVLVQTPAGGTHLLLHSRRLAVRDGDQTLSSLSWASERKLTVGAAFLEAVPAGPDLEPPPIDGAGSRGPAVGPYPRTTVGEVFQVGNEQQYFALTRDGLAGITPTAAFVLLEGAEARRLTPGEFSAAPQDDDPVLPDGYPRDRPRLALTDRTSPPALCARYGGGTGGQADVEVRILDDLPAALAAAFAAAPTAAAGRPATAMADRVVVPAGRAALVRALPAPGVTSGPVFVVTDQGVRHPVASASDVEALGYGGVTAAPMPTSFLGLLPAGASLSAAEARSFVHR